MKMTTGACYDAEVEWPNININGKIVDLNGKAVHRDGTIVRLTNNTTGKTYEFKYRCAHPLEEGLIGVGAEYDFSNDDASQKDITVYSEDSKKDETLSFKKNEVRRYYWNNAWDEHFRFMYNGIDCKNLMYIENPSMKYTNYYTYVQESTNLDEPCIMHNCDSLRCAPAVPPGDYKLELLSNEGKLIHTFFDHLDVSKANQDQLYDLTLELPCYDVKITVNNEDGKLCYGNEWEIVLRRRNQCRRNPKQAVE